MRNFIVAVTLFFLISCDCSLAFASFKQIKLRNVSLNSHKNKCSIESFDVPNLNTGSGSDRIYKEKCTELLSNKIFSLTSVITTMAGVPDVVNAAGPDWGVFEGRTGSLLHPVMMASMFLFSLSTALLGFQYRRQRTIGAEINALKKQLPTFEGKDLKTAISMAEAADDIDSVHIEKLKIALPVQAEIEALQLERKNLSELGPKDKHFGQGAILAFLGTGFAIEGPLNTYARAGKLFPGPHLYAGAGLVVLWSLAAATVPAMQKGNDTARSVHIGANAAGIGLFAWQIVSGWPILLKVIEKTSWP